MLYTPFARKPSVKRTGRQTMRKITMRKITPTHVGFRLKG